jgi:hypothetical protein
MGPTAMAMAACLAMGWSPLLRQRPKEDVHYDPNLYAAAVDTEVTYDDFVAEGYDDGYGPKAFAQFETALAPYGAWVTDPKLGRVWVPATSIVGPEFMPYATNGRWVLTEYGWTWDSKWDWGWAPFHYGRWAMLDGGQWCWIPGTLWAPAWVTWRVGRTHVGWAPLPPRGMSVGRPIGPRSPWTFARATSLGGSSLELMPPRGVPAVFVHTAVSSKTRWVTIGSFRVKVPAGPDPARCCGTEVHAVGLSVAAPSANPRVPIKPRRGAPVETRPWTVAGAREQTPIVQWPEPNRS